MCSKTKIFRSVLVVILALSLVGGLVVFRGFSLDENEGSSENSSVVAEATEEPSVDREEVDNDSNVDAEENSTEQEEARENSNNTEEIVDNDEDANEEESEIDDILTDEDMDDYITGAEDNGENHVCAPGECPENPMFINSVDDLIGFFEDLKEGNNFSGKYIVLGNDIMITKDQNKVFAEALKETGVLFSGEFDGYLNGNGYVIFIEFEEEEPADLKYLFEQAGENAAVIWVNVILSAQQESRAYTFTSFSQAS